VEELREEERDVRERLRKLDSTEQASRAPMSIRRLREHADDIRDALAAGDPQDQQRIFTRTVRSVTWLRNEETLELRLTLPEPEQEETRVDYVRARGPACTESTRGHDVLEIVVCLVCTRHETRSASRRRRAASAATTFPLSR